MKAGVRFVSYDYFKSKLADAEVCLVALKPCSFLNTFL